MEYLSDSHHQFETHWCFPTNVSCSQIYAPARISIVELNEYVASESQYWFKAGKVYTLLYLPPHWLHHIMKCTKPYNPPSLYHFHFPHITPIPINVTLHKLNALTLIEYPTIAKTHPMWGNWVLGSYKWVDRVCVLEVEGCSVECMLTWRERVVDGSYVTTTHHPSPPLVRRDGGNSVISSTGQPIHLFKTHNIGL